MNIPASEVVFVLDLDGTVIDNDHIQDDDMSSFLAKSAHAKPYGYVHTWKDWKDSSIYLTGRSEQYRPETEVWLQKHDLWFGTDRLIMKDSNRSDAFHENTWHFKTRILLNLLRIHPHTVFVFVDDDSKNVRMAYSCDHERLFVVNADVISDKYGLSEFARLATLRVRKP